VSASIMGYTVALVLWWADWAQKAQSSEQLPDRAFMMEHGSTWLLNFFSRRLPAMATISHGCPSNALTSSAASCFFVGPLPNDISKLLICITFSLFK
jgi:hypothetical protein